MSQLNVDSIKDRTGADQPEIVGVAKAFVNFNGTGTVTIRNGFNVSSITDDGTGAYRVNFTNALVDTNYSVTVSGCRSATPSATVNTHNYNYSGTEDGVNACHAYCFQSATAIDSEVMTVTIHR